MQILTIPAFIVALSLAFVLNRVFQGAETSPSAGIRRAAGFAKTFLFWAVVGSTPMALIALSGPFSWSKMVMSLVPGVPLAIVGSVILMFWVPAGKKSAPVIGLLVGGALPPVTLWTLALILPKNEATMGYVLFGLILAVPNAIAGAVAGSWRARATDGLPEEKPRPLRIV